MNLRNGVLTLMLGAFLASCGGDTASQQAASSSPATQEAGVKPTGETVEILLQSDDNMKYDKTEIRVKEGQNVKLTLKHNGTMPKDAMGHNFVLLNQGVDLQTFGQGAAKAQAPDFDVPYEVIGDVIVSTPMIGGGESTTIEFVTPPKGTYTFLCSFPGHYGMMNGQFIVE